MVLSEGLGRCYGWKLGKRTSFTLGHQGSFCVLYHTCHCGFVSPSPPSVSPTGSRSPRNMFLSAAWTLAQYVVNELLGNEWLKTRRQLQAKGWTTLSRRICERGRAGGLGGRSRRELQKGKNLEGGLPKAKAENLTFGSCPCHSCSAPWLLAPL